MEEDGRLLAGFRGMNVNKICWGLWGVGSALIVIHWLGVRLVPWWVGFGLAVIGILISMVSQLSPAKSPEPAAPSDPSSSSLSPEAVESGEPEETPDEVDPKKPDDA